MFVLVLLGFVATSWIITITLSAADASVHALESPLFPDALHGHAVAITVFLLLVLCGVFLLGFSEAVSVAIPLVAAFLALNAVVVVKGLVEVFTTDGALSSWTSALSDTGGLGGAIGPAVIAFPLLVLGLSGFETGVSMMPLVAADGDSVKDKLRSRIRNTRKLLAGAALIMSVYLLSTSFVTTVLIPADEFKKGGEANGRALAYLAHEMLGNGFGAVYDISTILILWFAGASAMAGLINIVPRYLPAYGMAPEWGRAVRPVVLVYTVICIIITIAFGADVNAQAGAYATGILAMMVSGAVAVTISAYRYRQRASAAGFAVLTLILLYALAENIREKPDGIAISGLFILGIVVVSLISRISRTTELRVEHIEFDHAAREFIEASLTHDGGLNIIANKRQAGDVAEYAAKEAEQRSMNPVPGRADVLFLEVDINNRPTSATSSASAVRRKAHTASSAWPAPPPRTPSLPSSSDFVMQPGSAPMPSSNGPKAPRSHTCCATSSSDEATHPRSCGKSSARSNPTRVGVRASTSADPPSRPLLQVPAGRVEA